MLQRRKMRWAELTRGERQGILAAAAVQVVLQVAALWDLRRRTPDEVRGSRRWWAAATFVNFVGPIAYFAVGRRRPGRV